MVGKVEEETGEIISCKMAIKMEVNMMTEK